MSATPGGLSAVPAYGPGHGLLEGRTVVVTAAAGTGIGFATAQRCVEEGATVVISDAHERRLGEAASRLAELDGGRPPTGASTSWSTTRGWAARPSWST